MRESCAGYMIDSRLLLNDWERSAMNCRHFIRSAVGAVLLVIAAACEPIAIESTEGSSAALDPGDYRLGAGDTLRVTVFGEQQLSGDFRVDGAGKVALPLIGDVGVADRSTNEVERDIASRLSQGYVRDPKVSVEVTTHRPFFILGEVRNPGQYPYTSGMTALSAIAAAGGFTYRAREDYVLVTRSSESSQKPIRVPVNAPIRPDDVLRVPERYF